ncbi:MAG TPA: glycosyltransferase [Candidatus Binatia bacterium]|nr:glycosyltransferase [Candidatus Binatia bacterium]
MRVRVHIFGCGPRMRRVAAALVADVDETFVTSFSDEASALAAGCSSVIPVILLDARVAVEQDAFRRFAGREEDRIAALATAFDGKPAKHVAAVRYRDGSTLARLGQEPLATADVSRDPIGEWLDEPGGQQERAPTGRSVAVHAYGRGFSGFATASRNLLIGLHRAGIDVTWQHWFPEADSSEIDESDRALLRTLDVPRVRTHAEKAVLFHPPTHTSGAEFSEAYRHAYVQQPYAHFTMFETDTIPAQWTKSLREASRVWVPSRFNVETFVAGGVPREQIDLVPIGLAVEHQALDGPTLHLEDRRSFAFLSVFEWTFRKGWDVLIGAWAAAFTDQDDVCLYIRSNFRELDVADEIRRYLKLCGHDVKRVAPIVVIPDKLSQADLAALYRSCDAFVLPSRGEGFGLPYLEAMSLGLPVIGTNWSGATDFLNARTGFLIDARLEPITSTAITRIAPIFRGQNWATPLTQSAAAQLRAVYDRRAEAATIGARGTALARTQYNRTRVGWIAAEALERIHPKTGRAKASLGNIEMEADIYVPDGMGASARDFLHALCDQGFEPSLKADGDQTWINLLRRGNARRIKAALARTARDGAPFIYHGPLERFTPARRKGATIVRTVATAQTCAAENIRKLARADEVWVPSSASALRFEAAGLDPRLIAIIPQGINVDRWTPQFGGLNIAPQATCRIVTMVNWDDRSGWDAVLTAFFRTFKPSDDVTLVLKVPIDSALSEQPNFEADVRAALGRSRLEVDLSKNQLEISIGLPNEVDLIQFFGSFDALVCASRDVGWGRPLLEAMACGVPVIAPRHGNHREFVNEDNALLVDQSDTEAIGAALRRVYERPAESAERAKIARRNICSGNSIDAIGRVIRERLETRIERLRAYEIPPAISLEPPRCSVGVIVDAREYGSLLDRCVELLNTLTSCDLRVVTLTTFAQAARSLEGVDYVAYLQSDVFVQPAWDFFLIDALRIRPSTAFTVPRTFNVPGAQGDFTPVDYDPQSTFDEFIAFATKSSTTNLARGADVRVLSCFCLMFEAASFFEGLRAAGGDPLTIEPIARALCSGSRRPWLAYDSIVKNAGSARQMMIDLRAAYVGA